MTFAVLKFNMLKETLSTFRLNSYGKFREVLAKVEKGETNPIHYGNKTQAKKRIERLDDPNNWEVYSGSGAGFYVAKIDWDKRFLGCHPGFRATIRALADIVGLGDVELFMIWRKYSDAITDQSVLLSEFVTWELAKTWPEKAEELKATLATEENKAYVAAGGVL